MRFAAGLCLTVIAAAGACAAEIRLQAAGLPGGSRAFAISAERPDVVVKGAPVEAGFTFAGLAAGAYCIEIAAPGRRVIGVDLRPRDAEGRPLEAGPVTAQVEKIVRDFFDHTQDFFDRRRIAMMAGTADRVVALVESSLSGDKTTYGEARGKVIYRLDLWDFEKSYGSWRKVRSRAFIRRTMDAAEFHATEFVYARELGGIDLSQNDVRSVEYRFPAKAEGGKEEK